ncbi:DUF2029 domain-containing protein [bacterium]|nr:DUF2029 domain-containing protein [bacterium]
MIVSDRRLFVAVALTVFAVAAIVAAVHGYAGGPRAMDNFLVFRNSYVHLVEGTTLYGPHPGEHGACFEYSPTFAYLFAPIALMPQWLGMGAWCLLNSLSLVAAILLLPLSNTRKLIVFAMIFLEACIMLQNQESTGLRAALMLLTFVCLERRMASVAALCVVAGGFISVYGCAAGVLFLFYPHRVRSAFYMALWAAALFVLPLAVVSLDHLLWLYGQWWHDLSSGRGDSVGSSLSVTAVLAAWLKVQVNQTLVQAAGIAAFVPVLFRVKCHDSLRYRLLTLATLLIWVVIFNHGAGSPAYVIAMTGIALWFVLEPFTPGRIAAAALAVVFTSVICTGVFPRAVRETWCAPYAIKAVPSILVWAWAQWCLYTRRFAVRDGGSPALANQPD